MNTNGDYRKFLEGKSQRITQHGFEPVFIPDWLFDFQKHLVEWSVRMGRAAIFADCGLGKTPMQLVWAENVVRKTNKPVLILTPLAVSYQTAREADKFSIECVRATDGANLRPAIYATNYERLHHFNPDDFAGVVCDESSILKNFAGVRRGEITDFMGRCRYGLLCTATAAPNDWVELGTSCQALGVMRRSEMLATFFTHDSGDTQSWRLRRHGERAFWQWVASWARACRKPSDLGFDDDGFILPPLREHSVCIEDIDAQDGYLFAVPARGIGEQRQERRRTLERRCERAAERVNGNAAVFWCHLNDEGDLLQSLLSDVVQVAGADDDEVKEERLLAFINGEVKHLITKPQIGGWGLNLQHCSHVVTFPSNSFEAYYQSIRRCWRFGQKNPVDVDIVHTPGDYAVIDNMKRKEQDADSMFTALVEAMGDAVKRSVFDDYHNEVRKPEWLCMTN